MDIKKIILKHLNRKKKVRAVDIVKKTGFSRAYIYRFFRELQDEDKIISVGRTNKVRYILTTDKKNAFYKPLSLKKILTNKSLSEDIVLTEFKKETAIFDKLRKNVASILDYGFTEILNNAIEHSKSKKILIYIEMDKKIIKFAVIDYGVGIFNDIRRKFKLKNIFEAIELLLKGKQTTAPETHSGEGIFLPQKQLTSLLLKVLARN